MENKKYTKADIVADLKNLGVKEGDILNVKVSFKSIGEIEGGVETFVEALLEAVGKSGTIVSDAFVKAKPMIPFFKRARKLSLPNAPSYAGIIANTMIKHEGSKRSPHPIQKFVAIGKMADIVLKHDVNSRPYSTLHDMCLLGAKNLRVGPPEKVVGVGTTHVAIDLLGYRQNVIKCGVDYLDDNNRKKTFVGNWPSGCKRAFNELLPVYRNKGAVIAESKIGNAPGMLTEMASTLKLEMELGAENPNFIFCKHPGCYKCRLTWKHSKGNLLKVIMANIKAKNFKNIASVLYISIFKNYQPGK